MRLTALEREKEKLRRELEVPDQDPVVELHPRLPDIYAEKVARLEEALDDPVTRTEAMEIIRSMIDRIDLKPDGDRLEAVLHGDLAEILVICEGDGPKKKRPDG